MLSFRAKRGNSSANYKFEYNNKKTNDMGYLFITETFKKEFGQGFDRFMLDKVIDDFSSLHGDVFNGSNIHLVVNEIYENVEALEEEYDTEEKIKQFNFNDGSLSDVILVVWDITDYIDNPATSVGSVYKKRTMYEFISQGGLVMYKGNCCATINHLREKLDKSK